MWIWHYFKFNGFSFIIHFYICGAEASNENMDKWFKQQFSLEPCQPHDCSLCTRWNMLQVSHTTHKNSQLLLKATIHLSTLTPYGTNSLRHKRGKNKGTYMVKTPFFPCEAESYCLLTLEVLVHAWHNTVSRLPWTSDQLVTETSNWQDTTLTCPKRDFNPQYQQVSGCTPTP